MTYLFYHFIFQLTLSLMPAWTLSITCYSLDVMNPLLLKITGKSCNLLLLLYLTFLVSIAFTQTFSSVAISWKSRKIWKEEEINNIPVFPHLKSVFFFN